jgi:hypothetical protein
MSDATAAAVLASALSIGILFGIIFAGPPPSAPVWVAARSHIVNSQPTVIRASYLAGATRRCPDAVASETSRPCQDDHTLAVGSE